MSVSTNIAALLAPAAAVEISSRFFGRDLSPNIQKVLRFGMEGILAAGSLAIYLAINNPESGINLPFDHKTLEQGLLCLAGSNIFAGTLNLVMLRRNRSN